MWVGCKKGVRDFISFEFLKILFSSYGTDLKNVNALYYASEPFDYEDGDKTYSHVHSLAISLLQRVPCVFTSVPIGKEEIILRNILGGRYEVKTEPLVKIDRVSLTQMNYERTNRVFRRLMGDQDPNREITLDEWVKKYNFNIRTIYIF